MIVNDKYLIPYFDIHLNNVRLNAYQRTLIEEVVFEDTATGSDLLYITIRDPDFILLGDPMLLKATPVKFYGGWANQYRRMFDGYISLVDVEFPEDAMPVITITCMDKSYMLNKIERKIVYKNMRYDQVVQKIAQRNGMKAEVHVAKILHEEISQTYETDIQFILSMAEEEDYFAWVKDNTIHYKRKEGVIGGKPSKTLWYRKPPFDIISFRPRIIQADKKDEIEAQDVDSKTKKTASTKTSKG